MMRGAVVILLAVGLSACATYDRRLAPAQRAFYEGRLDSAIEILEDVVDDDEEDRHILELELAMALQAAGRYAESARLLESADEQLEVLDYSRAPLEDIAAFAFAGETDTYQASPPERVMVNTQNMLNHLGLDDLENAAVEARRVGILMDQSGVPEEELFANRFAWGLSGLVFEMAGDFQEADDAWRAAGETPLARRELAVGAEPTGEEPGVILVVVQMGKVPIRREAVYLLPVVDSVHRLNVPTLVTRPSQLRSATVGLDSVPQGRVPVVFDLGAHGTQRFDQEFPRLLAAAVTQVIPRAIVAAAVRKGIEASADDEHKGFAKGLGFLASLLVEFGLSAVATTDTRCWSLLPETLHAMRLNVPPGRHTVTVELEGVGARTLRYEVDVRPGRVALVNVTTAIYEGYDRLADPRRRSLAGRPEAEKALEILHDALWFREVFVD